MTPPTVVRKGRRWAAFFNLCWLFGHDAVPVVDCDSRRAFNRCAKCGRETQYDFEAALTPDWIGFVDDAHCCPLCMGWKPADWDRCANEVCGLNPDGPLHLMPDGSARHMPDGPLGS